MRERVSLGWLEIAGSRAQGKQVFSNKNHFLILKKKKRRKKQVFSANTWAQRARCTPGGPRMGRGEGEQGRGAEWGAQN